MNREIRFRAWDSEEFPSKMIYQDDKTEYNKETYLIEFFKKIQGHNSIIMQFTGLKDKNGKEIFEEDIIQGFYENETENGEVYWDNDSASFDIKGVNWMSMENLECSNQYYEVIGNIYENPELLNAIGVEEIKNGN